MHRKILATTSLLVAISLLSAFAIVPVSHAYGAANWQAGFAGTGVLKGTGQQFGFWGWCDFAGGRHWQPSNFWERRRLPVQQLLPNSRRSNPSPNSDPGHRLGRRALQLFTLRHHGRLLHNSRDSNNLWSIRSPSRAVGASSAVLYRNWDSCNLSNSLLRVSGLLQP